MYTRTYLADEAMAVPENYDGVAFEKKANESEEKGASDITEKCAQNKESAKSAIPTPLFSGGLLGGIFPKSLFRHTRLDLKNFGAEELMIIGLALYLFFSHDGDKECAIMLALLLFIT